MYDRNEEYKKREEWITSVTKDSLVAGLEQTKIVILHSYVIQYWK